MSNGGTRANRTGQKLEDYVAQWLDDLGYEYVHPSHFFNMRTMKQAIYTRQIETGNNIYGTPRTVDLIAYHPDKHPDCLVIQCKWQASGGSVDEKYPFEVLSIGMNEFPTIIILDGGGYRKGAETWLRSQSGKTNLRYVFDQGEFQRYASRGQL